MQLFQVTDASGVLSPGIVRGDEAIVALSDHTEIDSTLELLLAAERNHLDIAAWFDEATADGVVEPLAWQTLPAIGEAGRWRLAMPVTPPEVWGCGVTY